MINQLLKDRSLILASSSPRREELLLKAGFKFTTVSVPFIEEVPDGLSIEESAIFLAQNKSEQVPPEIKERGIVITADTIVCLNGKILGKPGNRNEALDMLQELSGRYHTVLTGVCISLNGNARSFVSSTEVKFSVLTIEEIKYYVDNFKPFDKAGSYGIQEWIGYIGIEEISGSYFNVMGLPVQKLYKELIEFIKEN